MNCKRSQTGNRQALQQLSEEMFFLSCFLSDWIGQENLHHLDERQRRERSRDLCQRLLGGPDREGLLQLKMDGTMNHILCRLKSELPRITHEQVLVFSYTAAGFPNRLSAFLAGLPSENAVSVIRNRLRRQILLSHAPGKADYLEVLDNKNCSFGKEMLYLHDL